MNCRFIARSSARAAYPKSARDCDTAAQYRALFDEDEGFSGVVRLRVTHGLARSNRDPDPPRRRLRRPQDLLDDLRSNYSVDCGSSHNRRARGDGDRTARCTNTCGASVRHRQLGIELGWSEHVCMLCRPGVLTTRLHRKSGVRARLIRPLHERWPVNNQRRLGKHTADHGHAEDSICADATVASTPNLLSVEKRQQFGSAFG